MRMTLCDALADDRGIDLRIPNESVTGPGYEKARQELDKRPEKIKPGSESSSVFDEQLKNAVFKALDIALDDILGRAWSGWSELSNYADPNLEGRNYLTLSDHTIESVYEPSVDIVVADQKIHSFDFAVSATLEVQAGELEIEQAKIQAIRIGKLKVGGSIKLGDQTLLEKGLAEVALHGEMRLSNPLPIRASTG